MRAYILDTAGLPAPIGLPGELHLAGAGLALGYLGRDDLTAQRFVPDSYGPVGERMYRTGDRCRWRSDGHIEFLGRTDHQVKIRGHRIELGEIDARLLDHPGVAEAVTVLRQDADEPRLVAYLVPRPGGVPEPADLRYHLASSLPQAALPSDYVILDRLPLNANGKVDRAALPAPTARPTPAAAGLIDAARPADAAVPTAVALDAAGAAGAVDAAGPVDAAGSVDDDPLVAQLRLIWQEVLRIPDIGVHEDLFDLGGHSLTITRISGRIQQRLGVDVPLDAFFDTPTIAEIADIVRQVKKES